VFLRDWRAGSTRRISVSSTGAQANNYNTASAISPDGRYIAWQSGATNLVPGAPIHYSQIFVRDWVAGTTRRASSSNAGVQGDSDSRSPVIGLAGRLVAFPSFSTNLVPGDTNGFADIFVRAT
jgi:hypothetical protein